MTEEIITFKISNIKIVVEKNILNDMEITLIKYTIFGWYVQLKFHCLKRHLIRIQNFRTELLIKLYLFPKFSL